MNILKMFENSNLLKITFSEILEDALTTKPSRKAGSNQERAAQKDATSRSEIGK